MKRTIPKSLPIILILLLLCGCANLKTSWDKATPQEKTNIILYGFQKSLDKAVDLGIAYVKANPTLKVKTEWQTNIIPAMDAANKVLRELIIQNQNKALSIADCMAAFAVHFNEIQSMLRGWGIEVTL